MEGRVKENNFKIIFLIFFLVIALLVIFPAVGETETEEKPKLVFLPVVAKRFAGQFNTQPTSTPTATPTLAPTATATPLPVSIYPPTPTPKPLQLNFTVEPDSGIAPLNGVDLVVNVSGIETGPITAKFDCTNNGNWNSIVVVETTNIRLTDLCNYTEGGFYTPAVEVTRQSTVRDVKLLRVFRPGEATPTATATATATFTPRPTFTATPTSVPTVTPTLVPTATPTITPLPTATLTPTPLPTATLTNTPTPTPTSTATPSPTPTPTPLPTLQVDVFGEPSIGIAPLLIDVVINVSGTASGLIIYRVDCDNDGIVERQEISSQTSMRMAGVCQYSNVGTNLVWVEVARQISVRKSANVFVIAP